MATVSKPVYDPRNEKRFDPARIEHRTAESGLAELGTYIMTFDAGGQSDPWTLQYEETIFVVEGRVELTVLEETTRTIAGETGELLVLPKGSTVQYGATPGTRLLLSISPVDWRARLEADAS